MREIWKKFPAQRCCTNYEVSDTGAVRNRKSKKILKGWKNVSGYWTVEVRNDDGKRHRTLTHTIVAEVFHKNGESKPVVDHKNRVRTDNHASNLRWATHSENSKNRSMTEKNGSRRSVVQLSLIGEKICEFGSISEAAAATNNWAPNIGKACSGLLKTCGGFQWKLKQQDVLENEIWKTIELNGTSIEVSTTGRVKNKSGQINYGSCDGENNYCRIVVGKTKTKKGKHYSVHVLVMQAFSPCQDPTKTVVDHKDGNKQNNMLENLEWVTPLENTKRACGIVVEKVDKENKIVQVFPTVIDAASDVNMNHATFRHSVLNQRIWFNGFLYQTQNANEGPMVKVIKEVHRCKICGEVGHNQRRHKIKA